MNKDRQTPGDADPEAQTDRPVDAVFTLAAAVPPISRSFLENTLRAVAMDPEVAWSRLLNAYRVPAPTPDFVDRTVHLVTRMPAAPLVGPGAAVAAPKRRLVRPLVVAAAAALMLAAALLFGPSVEQQTPPRPRALASFGARLEQFLTHDADARGGKPPAFRANRVRSGDGTLLLIASRRTRPGP
jgi:hypothetical protein